MRAASPEWWWARLLNGLRAWRVVGTAAWRVGWLRAWRVGWLRCGGWGGCGVAGEVAAAWRWGNRRNSAPVPERGLWIPA